MDKITSRIPKERVKMHAKYVCEYATTVNQVWEAAIKLIREKYDGKQLTKRLTNELNEMFKDKTMSYKDGRTFPLINVGIMERFGDKEIYIHLQSRSYCFNGEWHYYDEEIYGKDVTLYSDCYNSDGTIKAERLCKRIEMQIDSNRELMYRLKDAAKNYDKWLKAYQKARRTFLDAVGKINPMFVEQDVRTYESEAPWRVAMEQELGTYKKQYV